MCVNSVFLLSPFAINVSFAFQKNANKLQEMTIQ